MGKPALKDPFAGLGATPIEADSDPFAGLGAEPVPPSPSPAPTPAAPEKIGTAEALGRGSLAGSSLGFNDESGGFGAWLYDATHGTGADRAAGRGTEAPVSDLSSYDVERNQQRALDKQAAKDTAFDKSHMGKVAKFLTPDSMFGVGEAGGTLLTAAAPVGGASAKGAGLLARAGQAAKVGAKIGGVAGFGHAEGTPLEQAAQTAEGAATGAVAGPVLGEAVRGVVGTGRAAAGGIAAARDYAAEVMGHARSGAAAHEVALGTPELAAKAQQFVSPNAPEARAMRAAAMEGSDANAVLNRTRELGPKIDELVKHGDVVKWHEDIASKGRAIHSMMTREQPPPDGLLKADAVHDAVRAEWDNLAKDVDKGQGAEVIRRLQREGFDAYDRRLAKAADTFDPNNPTAYVSERFMALDDLKRSLQKEIARGRVPFDDLMRERMETPLRTALEDPGLWGSGPAALQKVRNAGWTRRLRAQGTPERGFLADNHFGDAASDPYDVLAQHDPGKLHSIVQNVGTPHGELGARNLTGWADREAGLLEALTQHEGADPALVERAQRARQLSNEIQSSMGQRAQQAGAAEDLARIGNQRAPMPQSAAGAVVRSLPMVEKVAGALKQQPVGERAMLMAQLEDVLARNPNNREAATQLRKLGSDVQMPRLNRAVDEAATREHGFERVASSAPAAAMGNRQAPPARNNSPVDKAVDDPTYGPMLSAHPPGEQRDIVYSVLLQQDPKFRERERARAQEQQEEKD